MKRPVLLRRDRPTKTQTAVAFAIGIGAGLCVGVLLLLASGNNPLSAYWRLADGALGGQSAWARTLVRTTPLLLAGLAVCVGAAMKLWNIGVEGQITAGAVFATAMGRAAPDLSGPVLITAMLIAGAAGGAAYVAGPALARAHLGVNEILTTLLLNEVAIRVVSWLQIGPWRDPAATGFPVVTPKPPQATLPTLFGRAHVGLLLAVAAVALVWVWLARTPNGYEVRVAGASPRTAAYAGISLPTKTVLVLGVSGAIGGLAGAVELTGVAARLNPDIAGGFGYAGIIVAALAGFRLAPLAFVAFTFGVLSVGGRAMASDGVPASVTTVIQAAVLLGALTATTFLTYRVRWR